MDVLALSMKAVTFLGVVLAATWLNVPAGGTRALLARAALGAGGVALMVANAWLVVTPLALVVDLAYLGACAWLLARALASRPVAFEVVADVRA